MFEHLSDADLVSFINAAEAKSIQLSERINDLLVESHQLRQRKAGLRQELKLRQLRKEADAHRPH